MRELLMFRHPFSHQGRCAYCSQHIVRPMQKENVGQWVNMLMAVAGLQYVPPGRIRNQSPPSVLMLCCAVPSLRDCAQVVESLLHPSTRERLQAIRRYVEQPDGEFPPAPTTAHLPVPLYGYTKQQALEW